MLSFNVKREAIVLASVRVPRQIDSAESLSIFSLFAQTTQDANI